MTSRSSSSSTAELLAPFAMCAPLTRSDYYGACATSWSRQPTTGLALRLAGCQTGRATPGRFPRSPPTGRRASRPALPRQHRHAYAAGFQRGLPTDTLNSASESPPGSGVRCTRPISSRLEPVELLRGVRHWFLSYGVSSCLPDTRRLEVPTRSVVVRAALTSACISTYRLPSASPACCDRPAVGVFHPYPVSSGASWRTNV